MKTMISNSQSPVNPIPAETHKSIVKSVEDLAPGRGAYAAFDADGTLWRHDASKVFFEYLIEKALVPLPEDPKEHYRKLKAKDPKLAYLWLAQILEGLKLEQVDEWAKESFKKTPLQGFEDIRRLVDSLEELGLEIWVVTASVAWVVEAALNHYGVAATGVLGVRTHIRKGRISQEQDGPITWREGKADALLTQKGSRPVFCAGNTTGDLQLLELSQTTPLAIHSHKVPSALREDEQQLQVIAKERGWHIHEF